MMMMMTMMMVVVAEAKGNEAALALITLKPQAPATPLKVKAFPSLSSPTHSAPIKIAMCRLRL